MDRRVFVNEAFTNSIEDYLIGKNNPMGIKFNSFNAMIMRLLTCIYDELDITNPYDFDNESMLYTNLNIYGYSKENIEKFMQRLESFKEKENKEDFVELQKMLIDMIMKKKVMLGLPEEELNNFKKLLYSSKCNNPLRISYNFLLTKNSDEVIEYFESENIKNIKPVIPKPKVKLNLDAYEILNYSLEDIDSMSADQLDKVNKEVYNYFEISENAVNKDYLLDKAVYDHNNPKYATNGGFINLLLFLAVFCTVVMILAIVTFIII